MDNKKQTYRYIKENSILKGVVDEYNLSQEEYYLLYSFYVTYSMCGKQSEKKKQFVDYGWPRNRTTGNALGK